METSNLSLPQMIVPVTSGDNGVRGRGASNRSDIQEQKPNQTSAPQFDSQRLQQAGEKRQIERIARSDSTRDLPLQNRRALDQYQQTANLSGPNPQGELVGVDLFV